MKGFVNDDFAFNLFFVLIDKFLMHCQGFPDDCYVIKLSFLKTVNILEVLSKILLCLMKDFYFIVSLWVLLHYFTSLLIVLADWSTLSTKTEKRESVFFLAGSVITIVDFKESTILRKNWIFKWSVLLHCTFVGIIGGKKVSSRTFSCCSELRTWQFT